MQRIIGTLFVLGVFFFPAVFSHVEAANFSIEFGKVETVFDWTAKKCEDQDVPDSPAHALVDADGNVQLYAANYINRRSLGPNLTDVNHDCHVVLNSNFNATPRAYDDYQWMMAPYTVNGSTIYGLLHSEYHGYGHNNCTVGTNIFLNCWWNSLNLAKSTDKGNTFTTASPPNQNVANTSIDFNPGNTLGNIGFFHPSGIISKDGYYYATTLNQIPVNNQPVVKRCLMRTNNLDDPGSWKFWNGSDYTVPARGVPNSGTCTNLQTGDFDLHWSTYLNLFESIGSVGQSNVIKTGESLTNWNGSISYTPPSALTNRYVVYYSFLQPGAETRNFEDIGRSPWMYYSTCGDEVSNCTFFNDSNIDLKRVRVRFNKEGEQNKYDVLDLHFNEYKGTKTLDSSFYGNDGTLNGNVTFVQEGSDKFVRFNGGDIRVPHADILSRSGDITITARIRTSVHPAANVFPIIIAKQGDNKRNYGLHLSQDGTALLSLMNGSLYTETQSHTAVNDGKWHDIQVNFSGTSQTTQWVIDGKLDTTSPVTAKLADGINSGMVVIGQGGYTGDIDHVTVYNYLLPVPEGAVIPGDINGSGHVDNADYTLMVSKFGNPYTIYDYNNLVTNYGK